MDFIRSLPTDETTGRSLVLFEDGAAAAGIEAVQEATGLEVAPAHAGGEFFETLGVAVVEVPPAQLAQAEASAAIVAVEPERVVYALEATPSAPEAAAVVDEAQATWGLQASNVVNSGRTGQGIRVAVLDTGIDEQHPDFAGRSITTRSFVTGEEVQDGHGHGTHCIGTALGPQCPEVKPRYGIAYEAEIFAGKVLSNAGSGGDGGILAGIEWAIQNGCAVVSMSLGAPTRPGQTPSLVFERVARRAQELGTLIIAAAGNESRRPDVINPVGHPANCPSIMAVAALDVEGAIAPFSNRGVNPDGGEVDIAGPGVAVYSTWPMPTRYRTISGTSMATPHVAGIAALYAEQDATARGAALAHLLTASAQGLSLPSEDVGAGMVQAP
jgi:subtilisin family serine protease